MTTITAQTQFDPNNPIDYASAMSGIVNQMDNSTLSAVNNMISGLPSMEQLTQGAYAFQTTAAQNAQQSFNQTLFGNAQGNPQSSGKNVQTQNPSAQQGMGGIEGVLGTAYGQLIPSLNEVGSAAAANQSASISDAMTTQLASIQAATTQAQIQAQTQAQEIQSQTTIAQAQAQAQVGIAHSHGKK